MATEVINVESGENQAEAARKAADVLGDGGLVVFPTETVYGLGACVDHKRALERLREVKERQPTKSFTVHIGSRAEAEQFAPDLSGVAGRLARKGWPGPLTLVLAADIDTAPVREKLCDEGVRAIVAQGTIGLRCPDHPLARRLLSAVGAPVVASSANRAGHEPPHCGRDALESLDGRADLVIDAGRTRYAKPSTVVRADRDSYTLLRQGVYDERAVGRLATLGLLFVCTGNTCRSPMAAALAARIIARRLGCEASQLPQRYVRCESAGTCGGGGTAAKQAVSVMTSRGIDIADHRSRPLTPELINGADYVFVMTRSHYETAVQMMPSAADRVSLLLNEDLGDPFGGSEETYESCARVIERALQDRMQEVTL